MEKSAIYNLENAKKEFDRAKLCQPVFRREIYDINYNIRYSHRFLENRKVLTVDQAWQAVRDKARNPARYIPEAVIKSIIVEGSILEDGKSDYFVRLSVQRPFVQGNDKQEFTVVREEVSVDNINRAVYFMGRTAEFQDYKLLDVNQSQAKPQILFFSEHKIIAIDKEPLDVWTLVALPTFGFKTTDEQLFVDHLGKVEDQPYSIYLEAQKL